MLQTKVHFFDPQDPISTFTFFVTFKLACDTNKIHESAAMWVLKRFVNETIASALNSRMGTEDQTAWLTATVP